MPNWYTFQSAYDMYCIISEKLYKYGNIRLEKCRDEVYLE